MRGLPVRRLQRRLWRHAPSSLGVVLVLALAVAANLVAVSSTLALLAQPQGIATPEDVVEIWEVRSLEGGAGPTIGVSPTTYCAIRDDARSFASTASYMLLARGSYLQVGAGPILLQEAEVSPAFLATLGVHPLLGTLGPYMLSHPVWSTVLGRSEAAVGSPVLIEGGGGIPPGRISGVLPAGFRFPEGIDVWSRVDEPSAPPQTVRRRARNLGMVARLRPGVRPADAQAELSLISRRLAAAYPDTHGEWTLRLARVGERDRAPQRSGATMVWLASMLLLGVAWIHAAQLLGARQWASRRDVAVHVALGAMPRDVLWSVAAEVLLLTAAGTGLGLIVAGLLFPPVRQTLAALTSRAADVRGNWTVGWTAAATAILGAALLTWAGYRALHQRDVAASLQRDPRASAPARPPLGQRLLACAGIASSLALVLCAFGAVRTFEAVTLTQRPIDVRDLWFVPVRFPILKTGEDPRTYPTERFKTQAQQLILRLRAAAGVASVSGLVGQPGGAPRRPAEYRLDASSASEPHLAVRQVVAEHFLETARIRLLAGATLDDAREVTRPAVVDAIFAARHWRAPDAAIGQRFAVGSTVFTIAGVADAERAGPALPAREALFYVRFADAPADGLTLMLRVAAPTVREVKESMGALGPDVAHGEVVPASRVWLPSRGPLQLAGITTGIFAAVSTIIALVGIYAATSFGLTIGRRAMAIRLAFGASPASESRRALRGLLWLLAAAAAGGVVLYRLVVAALQHVFGPMALAGAWGWFAAFSVLVTAAVLTAWPTWRAAIDDPAGSLRSE